MYKKVGVIGCGPVGTLASLMLSHYKIDYATFDKFSEPRSHPSAHWLTANSKCIFSQLGQLNEKIDLSQESWENFRYYRYCESLFGYQMSEVNHFTPSI